jgi:hypothetical protein
VIVVVVVIVVDSSAFQPFSTMITIATTTAIRKAAPT